MFQHTAARRQLLFLYRHLRVDTVVSTHSRAEAAAINDPQFSYLLSVSTHSRAKAAAGATFESAATVMFQHTAARRRLPDCFLSLSCSRTVSTHSRAEAAAYGCTDFIEELCRFNTQPRRGGCSRPTKPLKPKFGFNTQPRGGGCGTIIHRSSLMTSFNTQPHGGGCGSNVYALSTPTKFQHTAARRRLPDFAACSRMNRLFQHTAARRRLHRSYRLIITTYLVSTHSRTEAAA